MPTVFIAGLAVPLPFREGEREGDPMMEWHAQLLYIIQSRRVMARLRYLLDRGELLVRDAQAKATELCAQPLKPYATLDDGDEEDPILLEAMNMAREVITARMAAEGLPPPKNIDLHAKQLVDNIPELQERARLRVEAHYRAAEALMGAAK